MLIGALSLEAPRAAPNQIGTRHETLRTIFVAEEGKPMQVILPAQEVPLPMIDLSELSNEQQKAESKRLGSESAARAFDLARGPLLSVMIFRIQEQEHVFFLNMHHIISDAESIDIFIREMAILYESLKQKRESTLVELPIQYVDYTYWQKHWLQDVLDKQLEYWRRQLGDGAPALNLPTDKVRPAVMSHRGGN